VCKDVALQHLEEMHDKKTSLFNEIATHDVVWVTKEWIRTAYYPLLLFYA